MLFLVLENAQVPKIEEEVGVHVEVGPRLHHGLRARGESIKPDEPESLLAGLEPVERHEHDSGVPPEK